MASISGQGTQNYYPLLRVTQEESSKVKELNKSVTVATDETMIVVGDLRLPDNEVILTIEGEGKLIIC